VNPDYEEYAMEMKNLQEAAAAVVARVPYCWLVTQSGARPMGRILAADDWTVHFVVDLRSAKVAEIQRSPAVQLIFQDAAQDAFVALAGTARLRTDTALWKDAYQAYFPTERDRANATFVAVNVDLMRLWIRGVTPEPFGLNPIVLERDRANCWHFQERCR
jgi:general stress protein 26